MQLRIVTISELRTHCNALSSDDTLLTGYGLAAEAKIIRDTHRTASELKAMGEDEDNYPFEIKQAVLMLVAHWYRVRETVSSVAQVSVPFGFNALVKPFRKFAADWREEEDEDEEEEDEEEEEEEDA